jgi:thiosulfate/3-mercaptopyruvate sulfurtransferase
VLYFGKDQATPTARMFVSLDYLGLGDRVSVLDGGLPAWQSAGFPITTDVPAIVKGSLTPRPRNEVLADAAWIAAHRTDAGVSIVDARLPQFYTGEDAGRFPRPGRIAGARSVPFSSLLTEAGTLKPRGELDAAFADAGVKSGDTVISYCHIGQQASLVYLAARWLGRPVRLYDGSFEEWSARPELPVETDPRR